MRILVTGATGFIGTHLMRRLSATDHELTCMVRETSDVRGLTDLAIDLVTGDVTDRAAVKACMVGHDCVIHLAGVYSFWEADEGIYSDVHVAGTRNVMECALELGVSKVVHISTMAVYGTTRETPFTEDTPVGPVRHSEYARTKYEGEQIVWKLHRDAGLPVVVLQPAAVVGAGDEKPTAQYIRRLIEHRAPARICQESTLTFVHVADVVEAIVRAAESENSIGQRYLVGNEHLTIREFDALVAEVSGVPAPKRAMPDWLTVAFAALTTKLADLTRRPPLLGLSSDQVATTRRGVAGDGSKAVKELGIEYTPVRRAVEEFVAESRRTADFFTRNGTMAGRVDVGGVSVDMPIKYYRDDSFFGFFSADREATEALLPSSDLHAVTLPNGRAVVAVSAFNYLETSIGPYGEVAVVIPCTHGRRAPALVPLALEGRYPGWGGFVVHLPVTNALARDGGRVIFGYPKFVADMEFERHPTVQRVHLAEGGKHILSLSVQRRGFVVRDDRPLITYSVFDRDLLKTTVPSTARYQLSFRSTAGSLRLGDHVIADQLRALDISPSAFATRTYLSRSAVLPAGESLGQADRPYDGFRGSDTEHGRLATVYDYAVAGRPA